MKPPKHPLPRPFGQKIHHRLKKAVIAITAGMLTAFSSHSAAASPGCAGAWPEWEQFKRTFITADGRVVDHSGSIKPTVSEGQAYSMFLPLRLTTRLASNHS